MQGAVLHVVAIFLSDDDSLFEYQKCVVKLLSRKCSTVGLPFDTDKAVGSDPQERIQACGIGAPTNRLGREQ